MGFLKPYEDHIYALTRMVAGLMFMAHGMQKLLGMFGGARDGTPAFIQYGAGGIELIGGALILIGLFTAPAAFLCSGTMAVAFFIAHVIPNGDIVPTTNGGELAALYCWVFFFMSAKGSGIWSVDAARGGE